MARSAPKSHVWVRVEDGAEIPPPKIREKRPVIVQEKNARLLVAANLREIFMEMAGRPPIFENPVGNRLQLWFRVPSPVAHAMQLTASLLQ